MGSLVLTRRSGESIIIGDDIAVRVELKNSSQQVKLVIDAPPRIPILRSELAKFRPLKK